MLFVKENLDWCMLPTGLDLWWAREFCVGNTPQHCKIDQGDARLLGHGLKTTGGFQHVEGTGGSSGLCVKCIS